MAKNCASLARLRYCLAVYRLCRSIDKQNVLGIVLGVLMILICPVIMWLVDIITLVVYDKVLWID